MLTEDKTTSIVLFSFSCVKEVSILELEKVTIKKKISAQIEEIIVLFHIQGISFQSSNAFVVILKVEVYKFNKSF